MKFLNPHWFYLLAALPLFLLSGPVFKRKKTAGIPFPETSDKRFKPTLKTRFIFLPRLLTAAAFILLTTALARPVGELLETEKKTEGIAMELIVDRSGSMGALTTFDGTEMTRLEIVKKVIGDFIFGNGADLSGRPDDLMGLISFARYADTLFPMSLSHDPLEGFIKSINLVENREEDGTSIGDALALACARLGAQDLSGGNAGYQVKSRIAVLITDGASNAGNISPAEAAELAAELGIKVYCIGFGGDAWIRQEGIFGLRKIPVGSDLDSETP